MAEIPSLPQRAFVVSAQRRDELASAFQSDAESYDKIRPSYPGAALDFALQHHPATAVDIGCGSGIFTEQLVARGVETTAVDPSRDMLSVLAKRLPDVATHCASGEDTGLAENHFDLVTYAQAWHWVDHPKASAEAARLLHGHGWLTLLWNQLDVSIPWVHRLARIMHAGDVHRPELEPPLGPEFGKPEHGIWHWSMPLDFQEIIELTKSRSYYRKATGTTRAKVEANLEWYWTEHLGYQRSEKVQVPYLTHAWRSRRRTRR
ncbi:MULTISPECIES: class I SAM-dependent methyltransferase [Glutamicibacter]|uniref:Class I SAM-dependent methyltransferase n=1 Tax=Glutamicibacter halophytocola TaxID=1933880 RepID=A0A5B8I400_9MICC|nr:MULTISPECIES: class I SAM-dependent methyltransferase [Glutamicibacter]ALG28490.1 ubiquinone biosynthesis protein [Glutamicibacter halophytocola]MBF6671064.1 class I SAM-dependent methyltransferase [Glutamicibacter sp. FBE19]NQD42530.1 class I SAM-dependent methyltransferase [Glutamicibacter halophytocola]QDY67779.1 class I SAM-dependent methyltransferase [Glutamicibacter halophytocola]UUX59953.1 class I SAM-dependent methyltransferase [Glutamicibacter halophytocola]